MRSTLATETGNEARRSAANEDQRKTTTKDEGNDYPSLPPQKQESRKKLRSGEPFLDAEPTSACFTPLRQAGNSPWGTLARRRIAYCDPA